MKAIVHWKITIFLKARYFKKELLKNVTLKNKPDFENLKRKLTSKLVKCQMKSVPDSVQ